MNLELLVEGLRPSDLENLVHPVFEVDAFKSKMGDDQDVCVVSFHVNDRMPAKDLMEFIEKGYSFVLDADVSSGENSKGEYHVFVEIPRNPRLSKQISEMLYGIKRLTGISDWEFKYHKEDRKYSVSEDSLKQVIPSSPSLYENKLKSYKTEEIKKFFNKTLMDDLSYDSDVITIFKPYGQTVKLKMVKEDSADNILSETSGSLELDNVAMGEIFWLTKVLGDYNINKTGDGFVFENGDKAMILKRIEQ
jgi:hypothetical protein